MGKMQTADYAVGKMWISIWT